MRRLTFLIALVSFSCTSRYVDLTDTIDPDIVLVNIEEGNRAFVGQLLLTIDSCKPKLIGVDGWFVDRRDAKQDSILANALMVVDNEILAYTVNPFGRPLKSNKIFKSSTTEEGLAVFESVDGIARNITPITLIDDTEHELFPLKIIKRWKPDFVHHFQPAQTIPIRYTRTLDQFIHINGSDLKKNKHFKDLNNKIVLLGYLGPSNEDKHFTPLRKVVKHNDNEPDTYGVVIVANEIMTILEFKN